jgi:TonB family protein
MNFRILLAIACVALAPAQSFPQNVQQRAEALIDHARRLSDIRSPGAPAFRLKATFSFTGPDLETVHGTYTEIWASNSQWRRETVVKTSKRIEIGGPSKSWLLDDTDDFPQPATQLPGLLDIFPSKSSSLAFDSITDQGQPDHPAECAITKPDAHRLKSVLCFDKKTGLLLGSIFPEMRVRNTVNQSHDYGSFRKFGDFWFPRQIETREDRHKQIEVSVVELSAEPSPDPALFIPPPGAYELGRCQDKLQPPVAIFAPDSELFLRPDDESPVTLTLSLVVDTKGKPQNVRVLRPEHKDYEKSALNSVRSWRFKSATCSGVPMPTMINVQVNVRPSR